MPAPVAELWLIKVGSALHPDGPESQAVFDKMPFGKPLQAEVKQKRSAKHHRLFWAICARIANALDRDDLDAEAIADALKIETGHFWVYQSAKDGPRRVAKSIAWAKMDQLAFSDFFERCVRAAYLEWKIPADVFSDLLERKDER